MIETVSDQRFSAAARTENASRLTTARGAALYIGALLGPGLLLLAAVAVAIMLGYCDWAIAAPVLVALAVTVVRSGVRSEDGCGTRESRTRWLSRARR